MTAIAYSDELLEIEVRRGLLAGSIGVRDLDVIAIDGYIRLCGVALSYSDKRQAESLTRALTGVRHVINQLRVIPAA